MLGLVGAELIVLVAVDVVLCFRPVTKMVLINSPVF